MIHFIKSKVMLLYKKHIWRCSNLNNSTKLVNYIKDISNISIGDFTYGPINVITGRPNPSLRIGCYCSIASESAFIIANGHRTDTFSTYPFRVMIDKSSEFEATSKGGIVVDDDVWIGYRAVILDGVHISQGAVIAAGAVVTRDVAPYAVVAGVPARPIFYRHDADTIHDLLKLDFSKLDSSSISSNLNLFYSKLDQDTLNNIVAISHGVSN